MQTICPACQGIKKTQACSNCGGSGRDYTTPGLAGSCKFCCGHGNASYQPACSTCGGLGYISTHANYFPQTSKSSSIDDNSLVMIVVGLGLTLFAGYKIISLLSSWETMTSPYREVTALYYFTLVKPFEIFIIPVVTTAYESYGFLGGAGSVLLIIISTFFAFGFVIAAILELRFGKRVLIIAPLIYISPLFFIVIWGIATGWNGWRSTKAEVPTPVEVTNSADRSNGNQKSKPQKLTSNGNSNAVANTSFKPLNISSVNSRFAVVIGEGFIRPNSNDDDVPENAPLKELKRGEKLLVLSSNYIGKGWYPVEHLATGLKGWVHGKHIKFENRQ